MDRRRENTDRNHERIEEEDEFHDTSITSEWLEHYERRNSTNIENLDQINRTNYNERQLENEFIVIDQDNSYQRGENVNEITNFNGEEIFASWNRRTQVTTERLSHTGNFKNIGNQTHNANLEYYQEQNNVTEPSVRFRTSSPYRNNSYQNRPQFNTYHRHSNNSQNEYLPTRFSNPDPPRNREWEEYYQPKFSLKDLEMINKLNIAARPTKTTDVDIKGVETFNGEGNKYQIIKNLETLFVELERRMEVADLSNNQKLTLLQQLLAKEPKSHLTEEKITDYDEAKRFLIDLYTPSIHFEEAITDMKKLVKKGDESYEHFARRVKSHANIISQKCGVMLESDMIFLPMTDTMMYSFPEQYKGNDAIVNAKENKSFEELLTALTRIVRIDPDVWKNKKENTKVKFFSNKENDINYKMEKNETKYKKYTHKDHDIEKRDYLTPNNNKSRSKESCMELDSNKKCEHCNLPGHDISKCQIKENNIKIENIQSNNVIKNQNYKSKCNFCGSGSHLENQCWKKYPHSAPVWYNPNNQYNNYNKNNNYRNQNKENTAINKQVNSDQPNNTKPNNYHNKYQNNFSDENNHYKNNYPNYNRYNNSNYNSSYPHYQYNSHYNDQQNF